MDIQLTPRVLPFAERQQKRPFDLARVVAETKFLPPSFELIPRLLLLLDDPDLNSEALAEVIRVDPGLTADVMQIANSATLGGMDRIETLPEAIVRLGLREIYSVVMKIVTAPMLSATQAFNFQRIDLWRHSLACAVASKIIGVATTQEHEEVIFTAGLLHDLGKVILAEGTGAEYVCLLEKCRKDNQSVAAGEMAAFNVDHGEAGARLLERWKFPGRLSAAIRYHHRPEECLEGIGKLAAVLCLGNVMAYRIGQGNGFPSYVVHPNAAALKTLGLGLEKFKEFEKEISEAFNKEQERFW